MKKEQIVLKLSDGFDVVVTKWLPENEVKAVVMLSHGMAEHSARYERIAEKLTENGFAFWAHDHRGHGKTAELSEKNGNGQFGYLADKNGFFRIVDDLHEEQLLISKEFPGKKIFLFGHSFGSFISQGFIENYGNTIDGCILCGTAGPRNGLMALGKIVGNIVKGLIGGKKVSALLNGMAFGSYNNKIKDAETMFDWLSKDKTEVKKYIDDPWCGFPCTAGFFCDMFSGLAAIHKSQNIKKVPVELPVFMIAGKDDPVGDYGKTVTALYDIYKNNGVKDVTLKLYDSDRHELLNETDKETVEADILAFYNRLV